MGVKLTHEQWIEFDRPFMELCTRCVVLKLPGYDQSKGVQAEVDYFNEAHKPVFFIPLEGIKDHAERWATTTNPKSEKESQ